jgi:protoheme IX farnesyltransferase
MKTAAAEAPALSAVGLAPLPLTRSRLADYLALTKPRVAVLVLFTVAAGAWLGKRGDLDLLLLAHTVCATALVAAGASALNQLLERHTDALMRRTENRPLPAGRLQPLEVLLFGLALGVGGLAYLALATRQPVAVLVAGFTFVCYAFLYTPLKRRTTLNTLIGAVPGAMPPVIGWTAVHGTLGVEAAVLFAVLFLWQVPHFLAIAWIYREDYGRAGLLMLPVVDPHGRATGRQMVGYCLALVLVSVVPVLAWQAGALYLGGALLLGALFLGCTLGFLRETTNGQARRVLRASLLYLPLLLALLLV